MRLTHTKLLGVSHAKHPMPPNFSTKDLIDPDEGFPTPFCPWVNQNVPDPRTMPPSRDPYIAEAMQVQDLLNRIHQALTTETTRSFKQAVSAARLKGTKSWSFLPYHDIKINNRSILPQHIEGGTLIWIEPHYEKKNQATIHIMEGIFESFDPVDTYELEPNDSETKEFKHARFLPLEGYETPEDFEFIGGLDLVLNEHNNRFSFFDNTENN
jgi:hypothetical protein